MAPPSPAPPKNETPKNLKLTTIDIIGGIFCNICKITCRNKKDYDDHYVTHATASKDIVYTCVVCYKEIPGYSSFRGHCYTAHVIKDRFKCNICSKTFSKQSVLNEHEQSKHRFKCRPPCNKEFSSKKELQLHQIIHKDSGPPYACYKCEDTINSVDICEKHVDQHAVLTYSCPICNETFSDKAAAGQHLTKHFAGETLQESSTEHKHRDSASIALGGILCNLCGENYNNKSDFDLHYDEEHGEEVIYSCNVCGTQYSKYMAYSNHCYNHIMKDQFKCDTCSRSFSRLSQLIAHAAGCGGGSGRGAGKVFACAHCTSSYQLESSLRSHLRDVHDVRTVMCSEPGCGVEFSTMKSLVVHQLSHKNIETYCRSCGLEFRHLAACEKHLDVHKKKEFPCPVCRKTFAEKYQATRHITQHFQSVLHVCKICGKIYSRKHRLVEHIKIHSENKQFKCDVCGKGFAQLLNLQQHVNMHTGEKPFECVVCSKRFASHPNWHKHLRNIHNIDPKTVSKPQAQKASKPRNVKSKLEKVVDEIEEEMPPEEYSEKSRDSSVAESNANDITGLDVLEEAYMHVHSGGKWRALEPAGFTADLAGGDAAFIEEQGDAALTLTTLTPPEPTPTLASEAPSDGYPREYGPDFINHRGAALSASDYAGQIIDLDDHLLPHIDPLLTIKEQTQNKLLENITNVDDYEPTDENQYNAKWEPPIITKIYQSCNYDDIPNISSNILSVLTTDIY
ncbi:hypothetical protein JYU34_004712 [Plutella xylostella]|uniref:C2H2-type domain-containing protein n=1 Tax=Plutella xylostella TaxID=51655 RepID=A0ABQ7QYN2_PLUXY|nr:hypothetical protein JYU34_004712 [Plutella xylostella]